MKKKINNINTRKILILIAVLALCLVGFILYRSHLLKTEEQIVRQEIDQILKEYPEISVSD